jgi:hypothetical protein
MKVTGEVMPGIILVTRRFANADILRAIALTVHLPGAILSCSK